MFCHRAIAVRRFVRPGWLGGWLDEGLERYFKPAVFLLVYVLKGREFSDWWKMPGRLVTSSRVATPLTCLAIKRAARILVCLIFFLFPTVRGIEEAFFVWECVRGCCSLSDGS